MPDPMIPTERKPDGEGVDGAVDVSLGISET